MPILNASTVAVGDQRKVAVIVIPSDAKPGLSVTSATYTAKLHSNGTSVGSGSAVVTSDSAGTLLSTAQLTFATVDTIVVDFTITWSDGLIDNSVSVNVPVAAVNT